MAMASDYAYDDSPVLPLPTEVRTAGETEFDNSAGFEVAMTALHTCGNILFRAREKGTIDFKVGVTERMFETMAILLSRAAHRSGEEREAMLLQWISVGPSQCEELVETVSRRRGKILDPDDFAMFLKCPRRGW
jgi:hypothetical protein